jgi:hypothetical protein
LLGLIRYVTHYPPLGARCRHSFRPYDRRRFSRVWIPRLISANTQSSLCIVTLGVALSVSCSTAFRGFFWLNLHLEDSVGTVGAATLGVGFPTSYSEPPRRSPVQNAAAVGVMAMIGVAWRRFSRLDYNGIRRFTCGKCGVFWRRPSERRRDVWRRFPALCPMASHVLSVQTWRFMVALR